MWVGMGVVCEDNTVTVEWGVKIYIHVRKTSNTYVMVAFGVEVRTSRWKSPVTRGGDTVRADMTRGGPPAYIHV